MAAKRRIVVPAIASVLVIGTAVASAAGGLRVNRHAARQTIDQPTDAPFCALSEANPTPASVANSATPGASSDGSAGACPTGMVEIEGDYCPAAEQICVKYIDEKRDRCESFRTKVRCYGKPRAHHFCMDRYEYPNEEGTKPVVAVTWEEAKASCTQQGKRLCTAEEWTTACEGPERLPHPYGFERDATACNLDRPYIMPDDQAYKNPKTRAAEVSRLSQSEPSGARPRCVSPYGVYDMTGNVDEWVLNENGSITGPEYESGLKGGYWAPVRNRCRPMTTDHNRWHSGYQIGYRCCSNVQTRDRAAESSTEQSQQPLPVPQS
jgi:hypothetical protein